MRDAGLIAPFERALMPLRRDGADALDPGLWTAADRTVVAKP